MNSGLSPSRPPKVLLFDIGGVCVLSPFQAIADYEKAHNIPSGWINFSISRTAPDGAWQRLERGEIPLNAAFFAAFTQDLQRGYLWRDFQTALQRKKSALALVFPPIPDIDGEWLFWEMMRVSRAPDPWMYPALKKLRASRQFLMGALSNTVIFPPDHAYSQPIEDDVRSLFDVFISSAHVGLRKPDPEIYTLAVKMLDDYARQSTDGKDDGVKPHDIVFLDDIGQNLKTAREIGMRTIKVTLGRTQEAVKELESLTGLSLLDKSLRSNL